MLTTYLNRLAQRARCFVGLLAVIGAAPILPLGVGVLSMPQVAVAQSAGDDVIVLTSGTKLTGKIVEETASSITFKFLVAGIEATSTYQKSEILSISRGSGATTPTEAPKPVNAAAPKAEVKAAASNPGDPNKKKVYVVELKGWFGEDISETPMRDAVRDAKRKDADYIIFVIDNDWSLRRFGQLEDIKDDEGQFDQLFRAEQMAPVFNEEIKREWTKQPTVIFWVKKAMGGAAFLPLSCQNIYMATEAKIGGIGGLNRIFGNMGDLVVREKQFSLRIGHAEGLAIQGGYDPKLIQALCRDEYVLSYRIEGGKPVFLERMPESPDEFLLTDDADDQAGRSDNIEALARGEGNDCLTINSDLGFKLGISKGTVDTLDDLIYKLGIARNHEFVSGNSKDVVKGASLRITEGWIDGLENAKRTLRKLWQDFGRVEVAAPGGYDQRTQARGRQKAIIEDMQQLLKKYEEAINPRQVPCPTWAELNIIKERLKTEQMADRREPR